MRFVCLVLPILLSSCAQNSGIVSMGDGSYMVSRQAATGFTGMGTLKADALKEAFQQCLQENKSVEVTRTIDAQPPFILGNFPKTEVFFSCVAKQEDGNSSKSDFIESSGTGFVISEFSHVVTNEHVVRSCRTINIMTSEGTKEASLLASDKNNDLAVLIIPNHSWQKFAKLRPGYDVKVGEDITVVGYPLGDILGSNVKATSGTISSTTGIGNDTGMYQISAPIQPGNSGGPLLDDSGNVIGVVTSKLNDLALVNLTGTVPQNVNFAIKNMTVFSFLSANNVNFNTTNSETRISRAEVVEGATDFAVRILCK